MKRRIRLGMVGGGPGAFIGPIHRIAAELDREMELVAGAFSSDAERSLEGGAGYGIAATRSYPSLSAMLDGERSRTDGIEAIAIATPNRHHALAVKEALAAGIAVMCDKPMTASLAQAREVSAEVERAGMPFAVAYTYSGYPMVREARALTEGGALGKIRKIVVEYSQGWLASAQTSKQAMWRLDPAIAGSGGCIADIGVHAFHLAEFVSGLKVVAMLADLAAVVPERQIDDDCALLMNFDNGARGVLIASQIAIGERNGLRLRVYGELGSLEWSQEAPNRLRRNSGQGRSEVLERGDPTLGPDAVAATRTPAGHPEGYLEAFANLYRDFARQIRGEPAPLLPGIEAGMRGMIFIDTAIRSSREQSAWVELRD